MRTGARSAGPERDYWPTDEWKTADAEQHGMRGALLAEIRAFGEKSDPPLSGIALIRHGYIVYEQYFRGFHEGSYHSVASITKSVLSGLVGIALERQYLTSLDQTLPDFFPEIDQLEIDPRVRAITLRHLLSMTTGWEPNAFDLAQFATNSMLVATALQRPIAHDPGASFWYDNLGAHLVSVLLTRATSMSTAEFARTTLLGPLGIWTDHTPRFIWRGPGGPHNLNRHALWDEDSGLPWKIDPSGHTAGYAGLHLTLRGMAKLGYLYLNGGWWDGLQLIPADYVADSTRLQSAGGLPGRCAYGYLWWTPADDAHGMYFGFGFGGQYVYVVPGLDLVVAIASAGTGPSDPSNGNRTRTIFERFVRPAVEDS